VFYISSTINGPALRSGLYISFIRDACHAWLWTKRLLLFPWARHFSHIAQYWLVPGTDWRIVCFTM